MQILALVAIVAAAMQGASPSVYGPPAPIPRMPGYGPSASSNVPPVAGVVQQVLSDIQQGRDSGQLSRKEARELRKEAGLIGQMEERFARDGLSDDERAELQNRAEVVRAVTNAKRLGVIK